MQPPWDQQSSPELTRLTIEESRSLTHGEFWIPEAERKAYQVALRTMNRAGLPFVVSGLYALYEYTGIYRKTKDLDLLLEPGYVVEAAAALRSVGFRVRLEQAHWLAKAFWGDAMIDLIYGMGNGLSLIDEGWYRYARTGLLAAVPVRIAAVEELIWHRLFVSERHRSDMADIVHLILMRGDEIDWSRLLDRIEPHWRLLLAQFHLFDFVYPGHRRRIPRRVREDLYGRAIDEIGAVGDAEVCNGTLLSRFSFAIDVNEWEFHDPRREAVAGVRALPVIREIRDSEVWENEIVGRH